MQQTQNQINTLALELIEAIKHGDPEIIAHLTLKLERLIQNAT